MLPVPGAFAFAAALAAAPARSAAGTVAWARSARKPTVPRAAAVRPATIAELVPATCAHLCFASTSRLF